MTDFRIYFCEAEGPSPNPNVVLSQPFSTIIRISEQFKPIIHFTGKHYAKLLCLCLWSGFHFDSLNPNPFTPVHYQHALQLQPSLLCSSRWVTGLGL